MSGPLRDDMIALGMPGERIRVHHTGVDRALFAPRDRAAAKAALGVDGPLLISVGYLIERKGQRLAIEALPAIPGATLLIVGQGPARAELEARIAALGLGDRVRMLGRAAARGAAGAARRGRRDGAAVRRPRGWPTSGSRRWPAARRW